MFKKKTSLEKGFAIATIILLNNNQCLVVELELRSSTPPSDSVQRWLSMCAWVTWVFMNNFTCHFINTNMA